MGMTKKDLVEYVRMKEHNEAAAIQALEQQAENLKNWEPVRHGRWILDCYSVLDYYSEYDEEFYLKCSECGREVYGINQSLAIRGDAKLFCEQYPYCHCGAKMICREVKEK